MKINLPVLIAVAVILIVSCAGGPEITEEPPEWVYNQIEDSSTHYMFRGIGIADELSPAIDEAVIEITGSALVKMTFDVPSRWKMGARYVIESFQDDLRSALKQPGYHTMSGLKILREAAWVEDGEIIYVIDTSWEKQAFSKRADRLTVFTGIAIPEKGTFPSRAQTAEMDGNAYEAALIWATTTGSLDSDSYEQRMQESMSEIIRLLSQLSYKILSAPDDISAGNESDIPFTIGVLYDGKAVENAEFVISYPINLQNGSLSRGSTRLLTDSQGRIVFLPPAVFAVGTQRISLAPSADPFIKHFKATSNNDITTFIHIVENSRIDIEYESVTQDKAIPIGVFILETDLAGNPLKSSSVAGGVLDNLKANEFSAALIPLDSRELLSRNERELLRDLKADKQIPDQFPRVIHGIISLESFEQEGEFYIVKVGGTLYYSDIQSQVTVYQSRISKTSRVGDSQQAMNAAFRQLGRTFASEIINRTK